MTHKTPGIRSATTAIAAVLAFSSTQLLAQTAPEATPPAATAPAAPVPDSAPAVTIPSEPMTTSTSASDPLAAEPTPTVTTPKASKPTTTKRAASAARPAKAAAPAARAPVTATVAAPVAEPVATPAEPVDTALGPVAAPPPPAQVETPVLAPRSMQDASFLPIAAAVGIGLIALIGLGLAMRSRRRRKEEEELAAAEQYEAAAANEAPAQPDPLFAEPAFAGAAAPAAMSTPTEFLPAGAEAAPVMSDCVDAAPGSHVEAACEGPTEDNPSLSIKKRLKRAQFFDEREQLVAAGMAVPVAADAGLPDAIVVPEPEPAKT